MLEPEHFDVQEQSTPRYLTTITGEDGVTMIPGSSLTTLTLTLYTKSAAGVVTILNGRHHQNILNANGGLVYDVLQTDAAGHTYNLLWQTVVLDTTISNSALAAEKHYALFEWSWAAGVKQGKHEVVLVVKDLVEVG